MTVTHNDNLATQVLREPLLDARDVVVEFRTRGQVSRALNQVSLAVADGEAVGLIGESGSGKTTLSRVLLGLIPPVRGRVTYRGQDIYAMKSTARHRMLGRNTALVFQDPRSSINPRWSVGAVVQDPLTVLRLGTHREGKIKAAELLEQVGLPRQLASRPVRALSGGQLQRVALARALAVEPDIIVADEPTSALDVSVQAQILNLLRDIRAARDLALLVVSHDIRVIRFLTDRTAIMHHGEIVEVGTTEQIYEDPQHRYTKALLASTPTLRRTGSRWPRQHPITARDHFSRSHQPPS